MIRRLSVLVGQGREQKESHRRRKTQREGTDTNKQQQQQQEKKCETTQLEERFQETKHTHQRYDKALVLFDTKSLTAPHYVFHLWLCNSFSFLDSWCSSCLRLFSNIFVSFSHSLPLCTDPAHIDVSTKARTTVEYLNISDCRIPRSSVIVV